MAISMQTIKPKPFNGDAFFEEFEKAARKVASDMLEDYEKTVETWEHPVKFEKEISMDQGSIDILVGTDDEIYGYVDQGTHPHAIYPKKKNGRLRFQWAGPGSYHAKTTVGTIGSQNGGSSGDTVAFTHVNHPGTKARKFSGRIRSKWVLAYYQRMRKAMRLGVERCGHKIS